MGLFSRRISEASTGFGWSKAQGWNIQEPETRKQCRCSFLFFPSFWVVFCKTTSRGSTASCGTNGKVSSKVKFPKTFLNEQEHTHTHTHNENLVESGTVSQNSWGLFWYWIFFLTLLWAKDDYISHSSSEGSCFCQKPPQMTLCWHGTNGWFGKDAFNGFLKTNWEDHVWPDFSQKVRFQWYPWWNKCI